MDKKKHTPYCKSIGRVPAARTIKNYLNKHPKTGKTERPLIFVEVSPTFKKNPTYQQATRLSEIPSLVNFEDKTTTVSPNRPK